MIDRNQVECMVNSKPRDINLAICAEECSELIKEITKVVRYPDYPKERLIEEMADVSIILEMLKYSENVSEEELQKMIDAKMHRNMKRITSPAHRIQACGDGILLFKICLSLLKEKYKYKLDVYHRILKEVTDIILERNMNSLEEANITLLYKLEMPVQYATYLISYDSFHSLLEIPNYDFKAFIDSMGSNPIDSLSEQTEAFQAIGESIPNIENTDKIIYVEEIAMLFPQIFSEYAEDTKFCKSIDKTVRLRFQLSRFELCFKRIASYYKSLATNGKVLLDFDDIEIDRAKLGIAIYHLINSKLDRLGYEAIELILNSYYESLHQFPEGIKALSNEQNDALFIYKLMDKK